MQSQSRSIRLVRLIVHVLLPVLAFSTPTGCETASVDRSAAKAKADAPESAKVEVVSIPLDPILPTFVVAILPFEEGASGVTSGGGATPTAPSARGRTAFGRPTTGGLGGGGTNTAYHMPTTNTGPVGAGLAAQLRTALSRWGNISIIDPNAITRQDDGTYTCRLNQGELGPFIVRGTVTEFNETADMSQQKKGGSLGGVGRMINLIGGFTGSSGTSMAGAGIAVADPTMQNEKMSRTGMVGIDVEVVDGRTTRLAGAFQTVGQFTTVSAVSGASVFGIGGGSADFAASALGQATRAAMNDALKQTAEVLRRAASGR